MIYKVIVKLYKELDKNNMFKKIHINGVDYEVENINILHHEARFDLKTNKEVTNNTLQKDLRIIIDTKNVKSIAVAKVRK